MKGRKLVVMRKKKYSKEIMLLIVLIVLVAVISGIRIYKPSDNIAAVVNGKSITNEQVDKLHLRLTKMYANVSREDALKQAIDEALLLEEADKMGIVVTDEDIDKMIFDYRNATGISDKDLSIYWESQGVSPENAHEMLRTQQRINTLLNETIFSKIEISDEEIELYREAFKQSIGKVGSSEITFQPSDEEVRKAIYLERAKNSLTLYLNQLRNSAEIGIK